MTRGKRVDLVHESDRGCVLVGAARLETRLEELFDLAFMPAKPSKKLRRSLFDWNGPLGTFSAKIKLAFALSLITEPQFRDLEIIRDLRNDFAHSTAEVDLDDQSARDKIAALAHGKLAETLPRFSPTTPKPAEESKALFESRMRVGGFVKATKSFFAIAVSDLEVALAAQQIKLGEKIVQSLSTQAAADDAASCDASHSSNVQDETKIS